MKKNEGMEPGTKAQPLGERELAKLEAQAVLAARRGHMVQASETRSEIIRILLDIGGPLVTALLPHLRELRRCMEKMGRPVKAEDATLSAIRISEQAPITRGADLAQDLFHLGLIQAITGKWDHALGTYGRAFKVTRIVHGDNHAQMVEGCLLWGDGYFLTGRQSEAHEQYDRAVEIGQNLPQSRPLVADAHLRLGRLFRATNRPAEAEKAFVRAYETRSGALGAADPGTAEDRLKLASFYVAEGRLDAAYTAMQRAMEIRQAHYDNKHPLVAEAACVWADIEAGRNRLSEAESLYQNAAIVFEESYGPTSPDLAGCLNDLASLYHAHGHYGEADRQLRRALGIFETAYGSAHPDTVAVARNIETAGRTKKPGPLGRAQGFDNVRLSA